MIFLAIWYVDVILCYFMSSYDEKEIQQQLIFFTVPGKDFLYDSCLGVRISYKIICVIVFLDKSKMC